MKPRMPNGAVARETGEEGEQPGAADDAEVEHPQTRGTPALRDPVDGAREPMWIPGRARNRRSAALPKIDPPLHPPRPAQPGQSRFRPARHHRSWRDRAPSVNLEIAPTAVPDQLPCGSGHSRTNRPPKQRAQGVSTVGRVQVRLGPGCRELGQVLGVGRGRGFEREAPGPTPGLGAQLRPQLRGRGGARPPVRPARGGRAGRRSQPVSPSSTSSRTPPTGTVTTGQPAIWASISTPGRPSCVAREHEHVERRRGPAGCRRGRRAGARRRRGRGRPRTVVERGAERAVAGDHEVGGLAVVVHRDERVERPVRSLLLDEVTDEPDHAPRRPGAPSSARSSRRPRSIRSTANGCRIAEVRDRPDRARRSRGARSSAPRSGVSATAASIRPHDRAPAQARDRAPHLRREAQDALPHDERPAAAAHEHRGLDRAAAVRDHDVDRLARAAGGAARAGRVRHGEQPAVGAARQRRQRRVVAPVEAEPQRDHLVGVAERVEAPRQLERDELRAAPLAPGHEMQDPHAGHRAMTTARDSCSGQLLGTTTVARPWKRAANRAPRAPRAPDGSPAGRGAILVLPTVAAGQQGPVAGVGEHRGMGERLAPRARRRVDRHARRRHGARRARAARVGRRRSAAPSASGWQQHVPVVAKTAVKDAREWRRARSFRVAAAGPWRGHDVVCVWQRHELFHTAGHELGPRRSACRRSCSFPRRSCGRPSSGASAGPGWSGWIERVGERGSAPLGRRRRVRIRSGRRRGSPHRCGRAADRDHADRRRSRAVRAASAIVTRCAAASVSTAGSSSAGSAASGASTRSSRRSTRSPGSSTPRCCSSATVPSGRGSSSSRASATCPLPAPAPSRTTRSPSTSRRWTSGSCWPRTSRRSTTRR